MKKFLIPILAAVLSVAAWASDAVNVNKASAVEIADSLKGIGLSKAEAIVAYREANGNFVHVDELVNVKGIGIRTIDQNRGMILLQDERETAKD